MKGGDQGGLSLDLSQKSELVLEQGREPGTYMSAWPESEWRRWVVQESWMSADDSHTSSLEQE